ncbi:M28 family peptidase [Pelomyxa schiedti]|nr:M28 family peptidase [Pelomyxa schiedti]
MSASEGPISVPTTTTTTSLRRSACPHVAHLERHQNVTCASSTSSATAVEEPSSPPPPPSSTASAAAPPSAAELAERRRRWEKNTPENELMKWLEDDGLGSWLHRGCDLCPLGHADGVELWVCLDCGINFCSICAVKHANAIPPTVNPTIDGESNMGVLPHCVMLSVKFLMQEPPRIDGWCFACSVVPPLESIQVICDEVLTSAMTFNQTETASPVVEQTTPLCNKSLVPTDLSTAADPGQPSIPSIERDYKQAEIIEALSKTSTGTLTLEELLEEDWRDNLRQTLSWLSGVTPIQAGGKPLVDRQWLNNRVEVVNKLSSIMERHGIKPIRHCLVAEKGANLFGIIPATVTSEKSSSEVIVLGAHYDSVNCHGADDNGTGVALVLQVALAINRMAIRTRPLLFVFFDLEETGLNGSEEFASFLRSLVPSVFQKIHSVHTVDMAGYNHENSWAIALKQPHPTLEPIYQIALEQICSPHLDTPLTLISHHGRFAGLSDFLSFPAEFFCSTGLGEPRLEPHGQLANPNHHAKTDTYDTIDFDYLRANTVLVFGAMHLLCVVGM